MNMCQSLNLFIFAKNSDLGNNTRVQVTFTLQYMKQGSLTEGEGSVQLTSLLRELVFLKRKKLA
jgi:hypothetical protein